MIKMRNLNLCVFVILTMNNSGIGVLGEQSHENITSASTTQYSNWSSTNVLPITDLKRSTLPPLDFYGPYDYNFLGGGQITLDDVSEALNSNETLSYLSTFNPGYERDLIYHQLESCPTMPLCGFQLQMKQHFTTPCCKFCICEFPACLKLNQCCLDKLIENIDVYADGTVEDGDKVTKQKTKCVPLHLAKTSLVDETDMFDGALVIDACPNDASEDLVKNCTRPYTSDIRDFNDIVPVMNIVNAVAYRNVYCAHCHNVRTNELTKASATVFCEGGLIPRTENEIIAAVIHDRTCHLSYQNNNLFQADKCTVSVDKCNITGDWFNFDANIKKACELYSQPIFVQHQIYKNPFCAFCNGVNITEYNCLTDPSNNQFTFSGLLKLENDKDQSSNVYVDDEKCSSNQLFDYMLHKCRDILCPPLTFVANKECRDIFTAIHHVAYSINMKITPSKPTTVQMAYQLTDSIIDYLTNLPLIGSSVCGLQVMYHCQENVRYKSYKEIEATEIEYYKVRLQVLKHALHVPREIYDSYILFHKSRHSISYFDYESKKLRDFEAYFELVDYDPDRFNFLANITVFSINFENNLTYSTDKPLPLEIILDNFTVSDNLTGSDIPYISNYFPPMPRCLKEGDDDNILYYKACPKILISQDETAWVRTDGGIKFVQGNFTVSSSEFFFDFSGNLMICTDVYKNYMALFIETSMTAMKIVSIVFSSLSILALLLTFTVFLIIPRLWNHLPGKINMSLVLVLLCAQCLYLICSFGGIRSGSWECVVVGIVLHYFWLLTFMWMNISTFHMYRVITRAKIASSSPGKCRFVVYHAYAAIMAALPVVINIIVSHITSGSTGYGDSECYLSSQSMVLYTFAIPLALVILGNICMYVMVVRKIKRAPSVQKSIKHERNDLIIFVKLSTVTGASWLFGLIYAWTDFILMSYISIILNAGQGVFIMYSFILNRRVLNMFSSDVLGRSTTTTDTRGTTPHS